MTIKITNDVKEKHNSWEVFIDGNHRDWSYHYNVGLTAYGQNEAGHWKTLPTLCDGCRTK